MSKLETNTIDTVSGTTNLTIGSTNTSTITVPNGKLTGQNYPAFHAYMSSDLEIPSNTATKLQVNTEDFDTDSMYDNSTNYRFTPTVSGKYLVYASTRSGTSSYFDELDLMLRLNGSNISHGGMRNEHRPYMKIITTVIMNGSSDYLEIFGFQNSGSAHNFIGGSDKTYFGAYRIGA